MGAQSSRPDARWLERGRASPRRRDRRYCPFEQLYVEHMGLTSADNGGAGNERLRPQPVAEPACSRLQDDQHSTIDELHDVDCVPLDTLGERPASCRAISATDIRFEAWARTPNCQLFAALPTGALPAGELPTLKPGTVCLALQTLKLDKMAAQSNGRRPTSSLCTKRRTARASRECSSAGSLPCPPHGVRPRPKRLTTSVFCPRAAWSTPSTLPGQAMLRIGLQARRLRESSDKTDCPCFMVKSICAIPMALGPEDLRSGLMAQPRLPSLEAPVTGRSNYVRAR